jgi:hypothetical protein
MLRLVRRRRPDASAGNLITLNLAQVIGSNAATAVQPDDERVVAGLFYIPEE